MIDVLQSALTLATAPAAAGLSEHPTMLMAYGIFFAMIAVFLALDLGVFHRHAHVVSFREASMWTAVWVTTSFIFSVVVYFLYANHVFELGLDVPVLGKPGVLETVSGGEAIKQYLTGYIIELSLSLDNVFVIAVVFTSLRIPAPFQHRVLFWGILGAILCRGVMIFIGAALVARFAWISYVFGGILLITAVKMAFTKGGEQDPAAGTIVRLVRRFVPLTDQFDGQRFFTRIDGRRLATPLLLALVMVEFTDVLFAVDSIPAIFAITADPFIVLTSNIFAILGLRSLYFCLAAAMSTFQYLKPALVLVLVFVALKMMLVHTEWKIPTEWALAVVLGILATGILTSVLVKRDSLPAPSNDA